MRSFKKINTTTGMFIEDCRFNYHPYLTDTIMQDFTDEEGVTTQHEVTQTVTTTVLVDILDEEGVVTQVEQKQPVLDPQYIATDVPQGFYWPKWNGAEWVEGGQAPDPTEPEPQAPTMEEMAIALMQTQAELEATTEALDFLIMGGM